MTDGGANRDGPVVSRARWAELDAVIAYRLLQLRSGVFVVEQACAYLDLDGRDLEPTAWHYWIAEGDGTPVAYLRVLDDDHLHDDHDHVRRIGRVVTAPAARSAGLARRLIEAAIADWAGGPLVLDAQSHLVGYYARFGFDVAGSPFVEDGIPHTPMRRP